MDLKEICTMKERPIIMTAESIKAILADRKTQTRRVMKPQPEVDVDYMTWEDRRGLLAGGPKDEAGEWPAWWFTCPYGRVGDRLWVRETWAAVCQNEYGQVLQWRDVAKENRKEERCMTFFRADETEPNSEYDGSWIPSIFMPRWASRLVLEITNVRIERVTDISEEDAIAEGRPEWIKHVKSAPLVRDAEFHDMTAIEWFRAVWDKLNAKKGYPFDNSPWVWMIEFKVVT